MTDEDDTPTTADEVRDAIVGALQGRGFIPLGFICLATFVDQDDNKGWSISTPDGQLIATSAGLIRILDMEINHAIHESFFEEGAGGA